MVITVPTILSHPAVALAAAPWWRRIPARPGVIVVGALLTALPDADVFGMLLGVPFRSVWGHRGITHSLVFALIASGLVAYVAARRTRLRVPRLWAYFALCLASHGLLDACTNGGPGVALFAPFSDARYFFPIRPIAVSPIGARFFSARGLDVLFSELLWVWLPAAAVALVGVWRLRTRAVIREPERV